MDSPSWHLFGDDYGGKMSGAEGFLSGIRAEPDDDAPRLVFADWLEDQGDAERAEFIRVQCELARPNLETGPPSSLQRRERELLQKHGLRWAGHLRRLAYEIAYARGFVEYATYATGSVERPAKEIVALAHSEVIRHLRDQSQLLMLQPALEALPQLGHLESLEFWSLDGYEDSELRELLTSPYLANLKRLLLHSGRGGRGGPDEVVIEGLRSPYRSPLTELAVQIGPDSPAGPTNAVIQALAGSPHLANLTRLTLEGTRMDLETARAFVESPYLRKLTVLDLGCCVCSRQVWETLLNGPNLRGLHWLHIGWSFVLDEQGVFSADRWLRDHALRQAFDDRFGANVIDWDSEFVSLWDPSPNPLASYWRGLKWRK
jgi:uncharacterized protein (TIGR02996 family)